MIRLFYKVNQLFVVTAFFRHKAIREKKHLNLTLFFQGGSFNLKFELQIGTFVSMMTLTPKEVAFQFASSCHRNIKPSNPKLHQNEGLGVRIIIVLQFQ